MLASFFVLLSSGPPKILIFGERRKRDNYTSYWVAKSLIGAYDEKKRAEIGLCFGLCKFFQRKMLMRVLFCK